MATGVVSWSKTAATNASSDSAQNWAEGMAPSAVNDSARGGMASVAKWRDDLNGTIVTGGTGTAYTASTNQGFTALAAGLEISFQASADSGATVTINVDSLGAKPLRSAPNVELVAGAFKNGSIQRATYATSNSGEWLLHGVDPTIIATNQVVTASIADANVTYAKIQNVAASRVLGNPTGSPAAASEMSIGSGLAFSGTSIVATLSPPLVPNYLSGLTLSTAGSSTTMSIAAGVANDSTNTTLMSLSAITKTTASWAVGSGNGGLDTGTISGIAATYHFYAIERPDTGVTDVIFSLSASAPALPTNYTPYRYINSWLLDASGHWVAITQTGDRFILATSSKDVDNIASVASRVNKVLGVPTGIVLTALFRGALLNASATTPAIIFTSLQETDQAPVQSKFADLATTAADNAIGNFERLTDTSAQIGVRCGSTGFTYSIYTYGWINTRGK